MRRRAEIKHLIQTVENDISTLKKVRDEYQQLNKHEHMFIVAQKIESKLLLIHHLKWVLGDENTCCTA